MAYPLDDSIRVPTSCLCLSALFLQGSEFPAQEIQQGHKEPELNNAFDQGSVAKGLYTGVASKKGTTPFRLHSSILVAQSMAKSSQSVVEQVAIAICSNMQHHRHSAPVQ